MTAYKIEFSVCGKVLTSNTVTATNNVINYAIPQGITLMPIVGSVMGIQVIGNNGENIIKSPIVEAYIGSSLQDSTAVAGGTSPSVTTQIEHLMAAKHTHGNKSVLDKFAESDGKPTYDGKAIGGSGAENFTIKMTVADDESGNYTVTFCDATVEQIDAVFNADKNIVLMVAVETNGEINEKYVLPLVMAMPGTGYIFESSFAAHILSAAIDSRDGVSFDRIQMPAGSIGYLNDALPNISTVRDALDELVPNSHTHDNKDILDKLSILNGKLQYDGSDVGLKGDKGKDGSDATVTAASITDALGYTPAASSDIPTVPTALPNPKALTIKIGDSSVEYDGSLSKSIDIPTTQKISEGSNITLADNTEYRLTDVSTLTLTYPAGDFESWMRLTFAASGNITVSLPAGTKYIGSVPAFQNGETWEISVKDGVIVARKVGDNA